MGIFKDAINRILPPTCSLCGREVANNGTFCNRCLSGIVPLPADRRWFLCLSEPYKGDEYPDLRLYMPFTYDDLWSRIIHKIKFVGDKNMASYIGHIMAEIMISDGLSSDFFDIIIPIPLSDARYKERGFNQAYEFARPISDKLSIPLVNDALVRSRNTLRQSEIADNTERSLNVSGAFEVNEMWDLQGLSVLLVDDVATTGHTIHEAACMLKNHGVNNVVCVAICGNRSVKNHETY